MRSLTVFLLVATTLSSVAVAKRDWRCPVRVARPVPADQGTVEPILWPIPDQCDKYYECNDDGTSAIRDCPPQMEFDMKTKQCGEATGRCTAKAPPSVSARVDDHLCVGQEDGQKIATNNCNSFIMCDNGVGRLQACEDGLLFDQEEGYCNWAQDVECGELVGPPQGAAPDCVGHEGEYLPNPYDCSTFYVCEHNAALIYNCEAGLYFDPAISNCNWKDSVQCVTQQLPEQQPWTPDCVGKDWTYIPNPSNCGTYYRCEDAAAILYTCPEGLLFDPRIMTCNWAQSVQC